MNTVRNRQAIEITWFELIFSSSQNILCLIVTFSKKNNMKLYNINFTKTVKKCITD